MSKSGLRERTQKKTTSNSPGVEKAQKESVEIKETTTAFCSIMESTSGSANIFNHFSNVVGIIFNNWTALKLALEHGMAGPPVVVSKKLNLMVDTITQKLAAGAGNDDLFEISDLLSDFMDCEFCTVLEDDSSDEVAAHLCHLYSIYCRGDFQTLSSSLSSLPNQMPIHLNPPIQSAPTQTAEDDDGDEEPEQPQEDGWTVVKRK